jgi:hypothetical protein
MMILSTVEGIWSVWSSSKPSLLNMFLIWNLLLIWLYKWTSINNIGLKVVVLWSLLNLSKYFISSVMSLGWWIRNIGDMEKRWILPIYSKDVPYPLNNDGNGVLCSRSSIHCSRRSPIWHRAPPITYGLSLTKWIISYDQGCKCSYYNMLYITHCFGIWMFWFSKLFFSRSHFKYFYLGKNLQFPSQWCFNIGSFYC